MTPSRNIFLTCLLSLLVCTNALAHHSFSMFDSQNEMWLEGTVSVFQWTNPHTFIHVVVDEENGEQFEWALEGGSPNILARNGWKRTSLEIGEKVRVLIYPLKSGDAGGTFLEIHKEDGTILYYHG